MIDKETSGPFRAIAGSYCSRKNYLVTHYIAFTSTSVPLYALT
jgi:hypothetical protein